MGMILCSRMSSRPYPHRRCSCIVLPGEQKRAAFNSRAPSRCYPVTREIIGENERFSVQAAVAVAERWTNLSPAEIQRFLSENTAVH